MSNTVSISNFAVDVDGKEVPIRYNAADLVNHPAPAGYVWQLRNIHDDALTAVIEEYKAMDLSDVKPATYRDEWRELRIKNQIEFSKEYKADHKLEYHARDYYIAVKV